MERILVDMVTTDDTVAMGALQNESTPNCSNQLPWKLDPAFMRIIRVFIISLDPLSVALI